MKQLIIMLFIILVSTNLVYSKGSTETSKIDEVKILLEEKKYNEAIAALTDYAIENPSAIYEVQVLLDEIRVKREENNQIMDELIRVLYDEEDFDKGYELIKELEKNNPYPDELSKIFLRNAREGATFVINQKNFKKYMDEALVHLSKDEYNLALDKYLLCLDFHADEFDLLMDESVTESIEGVDLTKIDENIPINLYYSTLKNASFKEIDDLKNETEVLKSFITKLQESYNTINELISSDKIDLVRLEENLNIFKSLPIYINEYDDHLNKLENYNNLFTKISSDNNKSKFISYATLTLEGRKNQTEGFLFVINNLYPKFIDTLVSEIEVKAVNEYDVGVELFKNGDILQAQKNFDNAINSLSAMKKTVSLWKVFIKVDDNYNIIGSDIIAEKYPYIGDAQLGIEVLESYKKLLVYLEDVERNSRLDIEEYRIALVNQINVLDEDKILLSKKRVDISNRQTLLYNKSSNWIDKLEIEYNQIKNDFINKEIDLLDNLSKDYYVNIFGFDVSKSDSNNNAMGELIVNASLPIDTQEELNVYFDVNNTDERTLITYNPEIALSNLVDIETEYGNYIINLESYIKKFEIEKDYIFENVNFNSRFKSVLSALELANQNKNTLLTYKNKAISKITLSKESENRGISLYENALNAFEQQKFNEARVFIDTGKNVAEIAISYSKNSYVINELIPSLYNLNNQISQEEARIVIQDVRKLITQGKNRYLEGAYIPASNLFREAELRWSETNTESHPEIPYWLALIRDALAIESGRYLSVTEPLYSILAGYLSFADNYYREGLKDDNKVNKLKYFAIADSYLSKVLEVRPLNERARFLQLQVLKSKDPEAFKVIFNNDFLRYRNNVLRALENRPTLATNEIIPLIASYEAIIADAYRLNPRLSGTNRRALLERLYKPISTIGKSQAQINTEKTKNDENRKIINESYIRFNDLYKIAENDQKGSVQQIINISEVALGFKRLPVDTSNIRESNRIFLQAQNEKDKTNQTEVDKLNLILLDLQKALTLNPGNEDIPVLIDDILVMLGEESNFQLAPTQDKIFREAQQDFIDGRYYDAKDKIVDILRANSKNKNYPKLKELINRVEIKIKEEITN